MVINSGSSSIKFQVIDTTARKSLCKGLAERIGLEEGMFHFTKAGEEKRSREIAIPDHKAGIRLIEEALSGIGKIEGVGHRMVIGGEEIRDAAILDEATVAIIEKYTPLAPLHNPPALAGFRAARESFSSIPHVGIFDTAFHSTLEPKAYVYPLAYECYEKHGIRRFGYHGTSHKYVALRAAEMLGKRAQEFNCVTCHLGNGSSITAVRGGKSVDTSLGFGTMCGMPMGTRAGDFDPDIVLHLIERIGMKPSEVKELIYSESGLKGISGISNDVRDIEAAAGEGNDRAKLALEILAHYGRKTIAAMAASMMAPLHAVVFTAGIGENQSSVREAMCRGLEFMGVSIDLEKNNGTRDEAIVSSPDSPVAVIVVPTNEELMIALDTERIVTSQG
jgi:acetate kinase